MTKVNKEGIILERTHFEFESEGVLNPAVIREGDSVHLFYRAVRTGNYSTIGYCRLDGSLTIAERWDTPILVSEAEFESHGVEDARIVKIEDLYYLTYTGYDGINARGALATSTDLIHFSKQGIIVPPFTFAEFISLAESSGKINERYYQKPRFYRQGSDPDKSMILWDKDVIFFPRKIKGNLVFLHRISPGIQLVSVKDLKELTREFWENYIITMQDHIVIDPVYPHESSFVGSGCPPIETEYGWLLIYHGVHEEADKGQVYSACAALLDLNDPRKEIARLPHTLFSPEYEWETHGYVDNVVFPTGTALFGNTLFIYYGAADMRIACATVNLPELVAELLTYRSNNESNQVEKFLQ